MFYYCEWESPLDSLVQQWLRRGAVLDHTNKLQRKAISSLKQHHMSTTTQATFVPCPVEQTCKLTLSALALDPTTIYSSHYGTVLELNEAQSCARLNCSRMPATLFALHYALKMFQ